MDMTWWYRRAPRGASASMLAILSSVTRGAFSATNALGAESGLRGEALWRSGGCYAERINEDQPPISPHFFGGQTRGGSLQPDADVREP
jgi:hypothetical protein